MGKILTPEKAITEIHKLRLSGKKIVLAGGCFDIIHTGHIHFLKNAKTQGDVLIVLLESDARIKRLKGEKRPVNAQADRALILSVIEFIDYVVLLPDLQDDRSYDQVINQIKPDIIATTANDPDRRHKERQSQITGAVVVDVVPEIVNKSTSQIAQLLRNDL